MENQAIINQEKKENTLNFSHLSIDYLNSTASRLKTINIFGYLVSGFLALLAIMYLIRVINGLEREILWFLVYIIISISIFRSNKYLSKYKKEIKQIRLSSSQEQIDSAINIQKKIWSITSIHLIISISIIIIAFIIKYFRFLI